MLYSYACHVSSPLCNILDLYAPDDFFITALENKVALSGCLLHVFLAMQQIKQNAWLSPQHSCQINSGLVIILYLLFFRSPDFLIFLHNDYCLSPKAYNIPNSDVCVQ